MLLIEEVIPAPSNQGERLALANYQAAMRFYIWAVTKLSNRDETLPNEEFQRLRGIVDYALDLYQTSRWELELARQGKND